MEENEELKIEKGLPTPQGILDIMLSLHRNIDEAHKLISRNNTLSASLLEREKDIKAKELNIGIREKGILSREEAIKDVEDLKKLKEDSKALLDRANLATNEATEQRKALETYKQEQMSLINSARTVAQREQDNVNAHKKSLEQEISKKVNDFLVEHGFKKPETK